MGRSDTKIIPFYLSHIKPSGSTALLGFVNNRIFNGDLYDLSLNNWDINTKWSLNQKYDTIICTRCAYFAKDPEDFISRCHQHLNEGGSLYVDWGLGDHWRFDMYKVGWLKNGEHEYAYEENNFLWSTVWSDSFLSNEQTKIFQNRIQKFGYSDLKSSIFKEVPRILDLNFIKKHFIICYEIISLWDDFPQIYFLLKCRKLHL